MTNNTQPSNPQPSLARRISLAFGAFFNILSSAEFAARVDGLNHPAPAPQAPPQQPAQAAPAPQEAPKPPPRPLKEAQPDAALQLLGLLQRDARLVDFTTENLANYSDADVGAAARVVHEGCRKVLEEHFTIESIREEAEGSRITLPEGFDAATVRLTGNVVGKPPFKGNLNHRGWRVTTTRLPKLAENHDAAILAQAEVEL